MATIRQKKLARDEIVEHLLAKDGKTIHLIERDSKDFEAVTNVRIPAVYIIRSGIYYKIGHTHVSILRRIETLQIGNPEEIVLVFAILTSTYKELEQKLHEHFKHRHHRGEWFRLQPEDEKGIETYLSKYLWQKD